MIGTEEQPDNCPEEYVDNPCDSCPFNEYTMVSHPGGSNYHSVKQHYCSLDYWKEDF